MIVKLGAIIKKQTGEFQLESEEIIDSNPLRHSSKDFLKSRIV